MANTATNFNVDPYYDDFDESKNFHRVLFKPGQAVQARELTQMQTILQNQIERFGNHVFEEGSHVKGGELTLDYDSHFLKLANTLPGVASVSAFANTTIRGLTSNAEARVVQTIGAVDTDPPTLITKIQTGDDVEAQGILSSASSNLTSVTLGTGLQQSPTSASNDAYNNMAITFITGTGAGQSRKIVDYEGSARRVHFDSALGVLPDTTTEYKVYSKRRRFFPGETIIVTANNGVAWPTSKFPNTTIASTGTPFGNTCILGVDEGIFYTRGAFVNFNAESIIVGKYSDKPTAVIGLSITESTVTSTIDTTLLDPAQGAYNYAAPGADRWKISLALKTNTLKAGSNNASNNFIELARLKNGQLQKATKYPVYSDIEKTLARRTFDESGNYVVNAFTLNKAEQNNKNSGPITGATTNTVRLTSNAVANDDFYNGMEIIALSGDAQGNVRTITDYTGSSKTVTVDSNWTNTPASGDQITIYDPAFWVAEIGSGKAYVNGHEIEFASQTGIVAPRARDFININNASLYSQMGNYIKVDSLQGFFNTTTNETVYLHYVPQANVSIASGSLYQSTMLGSARIRYIRDNGTVGQGHSGRAYKAYLYNIRASNTITGTAIASVPLATTTLNLANNTSVPQVDDIFNGATVKVTTGTNIDTVIVKDYIGSTRQIVTANTLSTTPTGSTTYEIKMNAKQIRSITAVDSTSSPSKFTGSANVALVGHAGAATSGNTILFETENNSAVMQLPEQAIKTVKDSNGLDDTSYRYQKVFTGVSFTSGVGSISTSAATERFVGTGSSDVSDSLVKDNYIVVITDSGTLPANSSGGFIAGNNFVLDFTTNSRVVNVPTPAADAVGTASLTANVAYNFTGTVIASIDVSSAAPKTKSKVSANTTHALGTSASGQVAIAAPNKINGSFDSLQHSDIVSLVAVYDSGNPSQDVLTADMTTAKDITVRYRLDTGQRDNFYDHGRIVLKPGYSGPKGRILVVFDRYTHSGEGYFSVDSYSGGGASTLYKNIPDFESPTTGNRMNLRDTIDFRPRRQDTSTNDDTFTVENAQLITPTTSMTLDYSYYIGRVDKIVLTDKQGFKLVKGVSAEIPRAPKDVTDAMTMWTLELPPYTFSTKDIRVRKTDNRRFTMRDIGAIAKRVDNLEYYTSLNLLEKDASDLVITDNAGLERFKNGIVVDAFKGHGVGDVRNEDYFAAVDASKNELRPPGEVGRGQLTYYSSDTGAAARTTQTGEILTCQYTEEEVIDQSLATRSIPVNPFNTLSWVGVMKLTPERDDTPDVFTKPDIQANIEGDADAWEALAKPHNDKLSTNWGAWETNWQGTELTSTDNVARTRETRVGGGTNVTNETVKRETFTTTRNQSREGFIPNALVPERETVNLGERVVDVNIQPYVRPQVIRAKVDGLKPNSRLFPFFDQKLVRGFCQPWDDSYSNGWKDNPTDADKLLKSSNTGTADIAFSIPSSADPLPEFEHLQFKTGERIFMVIDDSHARKDVATTYAESTFVSAGLKLTKETTMLTTRVPRIKRKSFSEARVTKEHATEETVIASSTSFRADPPPAPQWSHWDDQGDGGGGCGCSGNNNSSEPGCNDGGDGGGSIICQHLFKLGWLDADLNSWDQDFGEMMKNTRPDVMIGYWAWAKTIIELMYGRGPSVLFWIKDEEKRFALQARITQKYIYHIARPWAEHMAALMGSEKHKKNWAGGLTMKLGMGVCGWLGRYLQKRRDYQEPGEAGTGIAFVPPSMAWQIDNETRPKGVSELPLVGVNDSGFHYLHNLKTKPSVGWTIWGITTLLAGTALITSNIKKVMGELKGVN